MTKIVSKFVEVTPTIAADWLRKVDAEHQRKFMPSVADRYAVAMKQHRFLPNSDAITITDTDRLINGQHRLHAVVKSGETVSMLVVVGIPESVKSNGFGKLFTIDVIDRGKLRSVGQQLTLRHGLKNGVVWAGCANAIAGLANGTGTMTTASVDVPQALAIIDLYRTQLAFTVENASADHGVRSVPVVGGIAYAMAAEPSLAEFYLQVTTGENLTKMMPAYALRRFLLRSDVKRVGSQRKVLLSIVTLAAYHFVTGGKVSILKSSDRGSEYFSSKQKSNVRKVLEILAGK